MAGRIQIISKGIIGDQLLNNPEFSFFNKKYTKHTNWANENFKMNFDKKIYTDDYIDVTIPAKNGDILKGITLSFSCDKSKLPDIMDGKIPVGGYATNDPLITLIDKFGIAVIEHVELLLGDQMIDKITGDDIFIYNELNVPDSYAASLDVLHGPHFLTSAYGEFVQEWLDGQWSMYGSGGIDTEFRIQIPFYFHNRPKNGFPLCAINKQELRLRIKLKSSHEIVYVGGQEPPYGNTTEVRIPLAFIWHAEANSRVVRQLELENFTVNLDLVHLDKTERCKLQSKPINLLIEQHQHNTFIIEPQSKIGEFRLDLKNPVKEMYFIAKKYGEWTGAQISQLNQMRTIEWSSGSGIFSDWQRSIYGKKHVPLMYSKQSFVTLTCDGVKILDETTGNNLFLSTSIPNIYHKRSPMYRNINVYSFALQPGELQPSGHLDFSVIKDAKLTMELAYDGTHKSYDASQASIYFNKQVIIVAKSYNIIRINNGIGQILF